MLHAGCFSRDPSYRTEHLQTCTSDSATTLAQFCANDPATLLQAALYAQEQVAAIDINFGCPQGVWGCVMRRRVMCMSHVHVSDHLRCDMGCAHDAVSMCYVTSAYAVGNTSPHVNVPCHA